jgi:hypothetical protein
MPAENKIQTQSEAEEKMVDLPDTGSAVDVEIAETKKTVNPDDDTPAVETEVETASSEEMDDYGQKVQTRIDKLTKRLREAERREQAAVQYAQGVQKEAQQQAARSNQIDTGYVTEFADRVEAQMTQAKNELKQAMDLGDVDKQVEAQAKISKNVQLHTKHKEKDCNRRCRHKELIQINLKCLNSLCLDSLCLLVNLIQKHKNGLKRTNGLVQMNQ